MPHGRSGCSAAWQRPGAVGIARKYPRPSFEDPAFERQLAELRDAIIADRGGADCLSTISLGLVDRFVVLGLFLQSWEQFLRSGITTARADLGGDFVRAEAGAGV